MREVTPIGYIDTPYEKIEDCPRNINKNGPECRLIIYENFQDGLKGLKEGDNILILYWFDGVDRQKMIQTSRRSREYKGTFALRSPHRPNPIGASELPIIEIENGVITVNGLDCIQGTPILDIKPSMKRTESKDFPSI